jgi:hypothetical protein
MEYGLEPARHKSEASAENHKRPSNWIRAGDEPGDLLRQTGRGVSVFADMQAEPTVYDVVLRNDVADKGTRPDDVPVDGGRQARSRSQESGKKHCSMVRLVEAA